MLLVGSRQFGISITALRLLNGSSIIKLLAAISFELEIIAMTQTKIKSNGLIVTSTN